jgi:tetratricopeptide (TPR) repeat protein
MPQSPVINPDIGEVLYNEAASLVEQGQPWSAVPVLHAIDVAYRSRPSATYSVPRIWAMLGDAYTEMGRFAEGRQLLQASLDRYAGDPQADRDTVLAVRQRLGRCLLAQGDARGARAQFSTVLDTLGPRIIDAGVLARGGMARLALQSGDVAGALGEVDQALDQLSHVEDLIDARDAPYLWQIKAEILRASGDRVQARDWASRAVAADLRYDGEQSVFYRSAAALLQQLDRDSIAVKAAPP